VRITEDRYHREQRQLNLAMRMIRHEARTATIHAWTGLTADRIRKLHRQYVHDGDALAKRHRGKPPRQSAFFLRNADLRRQACALGGLYALMGLLKTDATTGHGMSPWLELFCEAYETYLTLGLGSHITFEHAAYLLEALQRQADLRPGCCPVCQAFTIIDTQRRMPPQCAVCEDTVLESTGSATAAEGPIKSKASRRARIRAEATHDTPCPPHLRRTLPRS
jgi:hypothetical protein